MINKLNEQNFDNEIKNGTKLVEFFAPWCGFCKKQQPELEMMNKIWIGQVNGDENPNLITKFGISGFPTSILFKDGKEVDRVVGFHSRHDFMDLLMKHMK